MAVIEFVDRDVAAKGKDSGPVQVHDEDEDARSRPDLLARYHGQQTMGALRRPRLRLGPACANGSGGPSFPTPAIEAWERSTCRTGTNSTRHALDASPRSEIRELLKLLDRPGIVSFAGGIPDSGAVPTGDDRGGVRRDPRRRSQRARVALQYAVSEGYLPLRRWLVEHMASLGIALRAREHPDHQRLAAGAGFPRPSCSSRLATRSWPPARPISAPCRRSAPMRRLRHVPGARSAAGGSGSGAKLGYLMPDFANPSGRTLSWTSAGQHSPRPRPSICR